MRNGAWNDHKHQQAIIRKVAEEAAQAIRSGQAGPQNVPMVNDNRPDDLVTWFKDNPRYVVIFIGMVLGAILARTCH
jgi:hypothetical protein